MFHQIKQLADIFWRSTGPGNTPSEILADEIFDYCKRYGPQSISQIQLGVWCMDRERVVSAIETLKAEGTLGDRPDGTETTDDPVIGLPITWSLG